jgi:hypothetical protein
MLFLLLKGVGVAIKKYLLKIVAMKIQKIVEIN